MGDAPWEKGYADLEAKTFGGPSAEIIDLADQMPHGGTVLDMGCGEGRNALFLARRGLHW
jgi:tellurite methyltransferase